MSWPVLHVVGAAILDDAGRCLVTQRSASMPLALAWEFPGGKVEAGESGPEALRREIAEELGVDIAVGALVGTGWAEQPTRRIRLDVYLARLVSGEVVLREHARWGWFEVEALRTLEWAAADLEPLAALEAQLARGAVGSAGR